MIAVDISILSANIMSDMPKGKKVTSPVEQFYDRLEALVTKLHLKLDEYVRERERIEEYIENIDDAEIRVLARKRFIENKDFQTIGNETFMHRTAASKKLKKYIEKRKIGNE